jgi:hypothetical protein
MSFSRQGIQAALLASGFLVLAALPWRANLDSKGSSAKSKPKPVIVLGVDGMDPDILKEVIERYPERMPGGSRTSCWSTTRLPTTEASSARSTGTI